MGLRDSLVSKPEADAPKYKPSLRLEKVMGIWSEVERDMAVCRKYNFFHQTELAQDGGLGDISPKKLLYSMQYINAALSVLFILMNTLYVTWMDYNCVFHGHCGQNKGVSTMEASCIKGGILACPDVDCINQITIACKADPEVPPPFMLGRFLLFDEVPAERIIASLEFFGLWYLIIRTVQLWLLAHLASVDVFRWVCVVQIFWQTLPSLSCFSLMRLLYYVTPAVIGTEAYYAVTWTSERIKEDKESNFRNTWPLVRYVFTRLLCAVIGFDAFLLKFRIASNGVVQLNPGMFDVLAAVLFLFQVLGVVNLTWFVRQRLFLFIFGSENGDMTNEQKAREIVWNAMVARKTYHELDFFSFVVIMLAFDDYDFQVLVMEHRETESRIAQCPQGHKLKKHSSGILFPRCSFCFNKVGAFQDVWRCNRCSFNVCDSCKHETSVAGVRASVQEIKESGAFGRLQAWLLGLAIEF
mmetsp:Transcript_90427/g.269839  ORF Transcript_90427/g.269839 Transcript_90427/m.269839 type:complete len:469 (-) Transcript_90427:175-1581(-)